MNFDEFVLKVQAQLKAENSLPFVLSAKERELCIAAIGCGIGPGDCACQIIDNRSNEQ